MIVDLKDWLKRMEATLTGPEGPPTAYQLSQALSHAMNTGDFEMPKVFADLRRHLDEATRKLVRKYVLEVERLTEAQLADVIAQAIEAGDFIRHIRFDGAQSVVYIPYAEVERLKSRIAHLEERLRRYGIAEEEEPEV